MTDKQCSSCGGFCKKSGCERMNIPPEAQTEAEKTAYSFGWFKAMESIERNFCPRCGKRTADLTTIHTCTPPQD